MVKREEQMTIYNSALSNTTDCYSIFQFIFLTETFGREMNFLYLCTLEASSDSFLFPP